jgi:hypothetical protein
VAELRQPEVDLRQRFLDDVFAVDGRAGHARTIAQQLRTHICHQRVEVSARLGQRLEIHDHSRVTKLRLKPPGNAPRQ